MNRRLRCALAGLGAVMVLAACGGGSSSSATTSTATLPSSLPPTTMPSTTSTVAPPTTAPTTTVPSATMAPTTTLAPVTTTATGSKCAATDADLKSVLVAYAKGSQPTVVVTVSAITHAPPDPSWARAAVIPKDPSLDGFIAIAHCVGYTWTVVDAGTSGVGCTAPVPPAVQASIGLEC